MNRLLGSFVLAVGLMLFPVGQLVCGQQQTNDATQLARVKAEIAKSDKLRVTIKLRNGSELKGRITQSSDNTFTLRQDKTSSQRDISYAEVVKVKGQGLSRGAKFGILTAIVAGAVVIGALISLKNFDPFENGVLR
jgi:small nuclear ribonucleoprotein (snRNP)-like protein